jgi:lysophospholipase L1-like esterase
MKFIHVPAAKNNIMLAIIYVILLHLVVGFLLIKPNFLNRLYRKLKMRNVSIDGPEYYMETQWDYFSIKSRTLKQESNQFVFLGDSLITVLCVENLFSGINLGIAGESVKRAKDKIPLLSNLANKNIVLSYGINDIPNPSAEIVSDYVALIERLPLSAEIYISSILPVDETAAVKYFNPPKSNRQIHELNLLLSEYAKSNERIHFLCTNTYLLDTNGGLKKSFHKGDGIHLNEQGNLLWFKAIQEELQGSKKSFLNN